MSDKYQKQITSTQINVFNLQNKRMEDITFENDTARCLIGGRRFIDMNLDQLIKCRDEKMRLVNAKGA